MECLPQHNCLASPHPPLNNQLNMEFQRGPLRVANHYDCDHPSLKILLIAQILVYSQQQLKTRTLSSGDGFSVLETFPPWLGGGTNRMVLLVTPNRRWPYRDRYAPRNANRGAVQTSRRKFNHRLDLRTLQSTKPSKNIVNIRTTFRILKDGGNRHPRVLQNPRTTHLAGNTLNHGTLRPVDCANRLSCNRRRLRGDFLNPIFDSKSISGRPRGNRLCLLVREFNLDR